MATETKKIPQTAQTAARLIQQQSHGALTELARQMVDDLGLKEDDSWHVDFAAGTMTRDIPDITPDVPAGSDAP